VMHQQEQLEAYILCRYFASCQYTIIGQDGLIRENYLQHLRDEHKRRHVRVEEDELKRDGAVRLEDYDPLKNTATLIGADVVLGHASSQARVLLSANGGVKVLPAEDAK
jgi:hypothetical protein